MNAKEAREAAEKVKNSYLIDQYEVLKVAIRKEADEGEFHFYFYEEMHHGVIEMLGREGYVIEDMTSQRDGALFKISW